MLWCMLAILARKVSQTDHEFFGVESMFLDLGRIPTSQCFKIPLSSSRLLCLCCIYFGLVSNRIKDYWEKLVPVPSICSFWSVVRRGNVNWDWICRYCIFMWDRLYKYPLSSCKCHLSLHYNLTTNGLPSNLGVSLLSERFKFLDDLGLRRTIYNA